VVEDLKNIVAEPNTKINIGIGIRLPAPQLGLPFGMRPISLRFAQRIFGAFILVNKRGENCNFPEPGRG